MFFTPELLAKRDSGFGLLWLAATLGSKSAFKRLPRRSVITADISELCDLISQPAEPLALRLSSNLMFGVVRVYKVKQEIFLADVTNCATSLKKVVQEMNSKVEDSRLQLAQSSVRPSTITINPDSRAAHIVDYEAFVTDWDEFLNIVEGPAPKRGQDAEDDDDDYDPNKVNKGPKAKAKPTSTQAVEAVRKEAHTLEEHHQHLLTTSFDASFVGNLPGFDSSSQPAAVIDFDDQNIFDFSDGIDVGDVLGGLGDDLAREIGWASPEKQMSRSPEARLERDRMGAFEEPFNFDIDMATTPQFEDGNDCGPLQSIALDRGVSLPRTPGRKTKVNPINDNKENQYPGSIQREQSLTRDASPATPFASQFLARDTNMDGPLQDVTIEDTNQSGPKNRKKRTRLLLDARTELTDEELKVARAKYLEHQKNLRREVLVKRAEKEGNRLIDQYIYAAPKGIQDEGLIEFWRSTVKVQVDARAGLLSIHDEEERPVSKRRKTATPAVQDGPAAFVDHEYDVDFNFMGDPAQGEDPGALRRSSEEPGQGRYVSRPSSAFGGSNIGLEIGPLNGSNGSQRSSLFPWDHAGANSSSSGNVPFRDNDVVIDPVETRVRGSSQSRRSSVPGSQQGRPGTPQGQGFSPVPVRLGSPKQQEPDYEFDVPDVLPEETQDDTQKTEDNAIVLEKNSLNFLEYARMQSRTLPGDSDGKLSFDTVVPPDTSTRHVAAAAFHHCLVLATKNLVRLQQDEPFATVFMTII
ncbi:hypothetical protein CC2G_001155 [Coprinopsis cinerea AmutBmut pab1-1]|nr:hypothetical protein CC2G_001155 [Coprinopsis cinerea AmutBmut pab1-1]